MRRVLNANPTAAKTSKGVSGRPGDEDVAARRAIRAVVVALLAIAGVLMLAACGSSSSSSAPAHASASSGLSTAATDPNATVVVDSAVAPAQLDPTQSETNLEIGWISSMYSTLTQAAHLSGAVAGASQQDLNPKDAKPYLAESWQFSDDYRTLTLHLRPGLKFPSGDPIDSKAVKWSLEGAIRVGAGGDSVFQETQFKPPLVQSIMTPTATTVVIHYSRPAPNQAGVLAAPQLAIFDPALVEAHGGLKLKKINTWLASHPAGYGPYLLKSYSPGHQLVLEANPNFFEPPKNKKVIVNFVGSETTLLLDAKSGAADVTIGLSDQGAHSLEGNSCCTVMASNSATQEEIVMPEEHQFPEFENQDFRQALSYAFPYEAVLSKVAFGYAKLYDGLWPPVMEGYDTSIAKVHEFNLAKAKELLKASGVKTPVSFPLYIEQGEALPREIAAIAASSWGQLGVNASVQTVSSSDFYSEVTEKHLGAIVREEGTQVVAPDYFWGFELQCPEANPFNAALYCNHTTDKLMKELEAGAFLDDHTRELEVLHQVDEAWIAAAPKIWIFNADFVSVVGRNITSFYASRFPTLRLYGKS
jgi:peptide/nickel transport system substrate-binding protein